MHDIIVSHYIFTTRGTIREWVDSLCIGIYMYMYIYYVCASILHAWVHWPWLTCGKFNKWSLIYSSLHCSANSVIARSLSPEHLILYVGWGKYRSHSLCCVHRWMSCPMVVQYREQISVHFPAVFLQFQGNYRIVYRKLRPVLYHPCIGNLSFLPVVGSTYISPLGWFILASCG